jgi:hypothetical protein
MTIINMRNPTMTPHTTAMVTGVLALGDIGPLTSPAKRIEFVFTGISSCRSERLN